MQDSGIEAMGLPFIPEHLMDDARGCVEVIKQSMPDKVYSALDSFLLAAFGTAWALHKMAALKLSDPNFEFIIEVGENGAKAQNPWLSILNKQATMMVSIAARHARAISDTRLSLGSATICSSSVTPLRPTGATMPN